MSNTWALQQALSGGSPTIPEHDNSTFLRLLDQLREEHDLQISSLSRTITDLNRAIRKAGGAKNVIFEPDPDSDSKSAMAAERQDAGAEGEDSQEVKENQSGSGSPKLMRKATQSGSQFAHLGILHNNMTYSGEEQVSQYKRFQRFVQSAAFETTFAALIVFNALVMAADVQRSGTDIGAALGYAEYVPTDVTLPWAQAVFTAFEYIFGIAFTFEILTKLIAFKLLNFAKDAWNWFDSFLVACWYIDIISRAVAQGEGVLPVNTTLLRLLRLMRLLRLLRLVRLIKTFDSLYLMTTALKGSALILTWACVLLMVLQILIALLLNQVLYDAYLEQSAYPIEERLEVFEYFGTFTRSMLSMFEITLGNWPPVCRLLSEKVSEWFMLLCILHKLVIGFAVVGVINGVFIQETFKVASSDNQIMMRQKERSSNLHEMKMRQLFMEADNDGDGLVSPDEWRELVSHPAVQLWLGSMDLDAADADGLYQLIHDLDQDGDLTVEELIRGVARLKGTARSYDLQMLLRQVLALTDSVDMLNIRMRKLRPEGEDEVELNDTGGEGRLAHLMKGSAWRR